MFGYVLAQRGMLRVWELNRYKAEYCGLCHALKREYGFFARFLVNYDFTFLSMVLSLYDPEAPLCHGRCAANLFAQKQIAPPRPSSQAATALSVLLYAGKLRDTVQDDPFWHALPARAALLTLRNAHKKAVAHFPHFAEAMNQSLARLRDLETQRSDSLDAPADTFASLLSLLGQQAPNDEARRILTQLFYHLGRMIYLFDAVHDLPQDDKDNRYNPVAARFSLQNGVLPDDVKETLTQTLTLSWESVATAFVLLPKGRAYTVLENIVYRGLPAVWQDILEGRFNSRNAQKHRHRHEPAQE